MLVCKSQKNIWILFQLSNRLQETVNLLDDLDTLKDELYPLARRAAMLYAIVRSLQSIHKEYQFSLSYFMYLFDEAVGGEMPAGFGYNLRMDDVCHSFFN